LKEDLENVRSHRRTDSSSFLFIHSNDSLG
jgi:hypothetical protein